MIHIHDVSKQYGSKLLFEGASVHLTPRSRMALVGPNGSGKTTLFKMLLGFEEPDSGTVTRTSHLAVGYLAQDLPKTSAYTVLAETMRLDGRREELLAAKRELEEKFIEKATKADLSRYGRIQEELEHLNEYRLESRAKEILTGMGFRESDFHRPLTEFSGGWLMRVALSRILLMDPDLLLLDEPTNHLDLESLLWLESFLADYQGAILVVSHDTEFLNRVVSGVLEIDQKRLWLYKGNIESFAKQKQERLESLRAQYAGQQAKIAEMQAFIDRFRAKATKARQAQSRMKQLEKMERIELPEHRASIRFCFPPAPHSGREIVTMKHASVGYGDMMIFRDLDWIIQRGARIIVVGVNGAGKTTLLKLLAGQMDPITGSRTFGHEVRVGYYAQHQAEALNMDLTVFEELRLAAPALPLTHIRSVAGAFLFSGDAIEKKCRVLSGGEKARVALAKLLLSPSNFLILDEPTNHLDAESRAVLLDALQAYEGTLCIVSHDRAFVGPLVDTILEIEPSRSADGAPAPSTARGSKVTQFLGNYEDYIAKKIRQAAEEKQWSAAAKPVKAPETVQFKTGITNNQKRSWERKRDQIESDITIIERRQLELQELLGNPTTYTDRAKWAALASEQKTLEMALEEKLKQWEEVCALLG